MFHLQCYGTWNICGQVAQTKPPAADFGSSCEKKEGSARCCCAFTNFSMYHSLEWLNLVWLFVVLLSMAVSHQLLQLHHILHENNLELPSCGCVSLLRTHKTLNHKKTTSVGGFKVSIVSILEKASFQSFDSSRDNILT